MSNVPYRHRRSTPKEERQLGIFMVSLFGSAIILCIACLITEGLVFVLPTIFIVPASAYAVKEGIKEIKNANKKLKQLDGAESKHK